MNEKKPGTVIPLFAASLRKHLTLDQIVSLESCLDCRNCGNACAWHLQNSGDYRMHPKYKKDFVRSFYRRFLTIEGRLLGFIGLLKTPTVEDLRVNMEYFWKCSACGRCTLACPLGLNNRELIRSARAAYFESGLSLEHPVLRSILENMRTFRHSQGLRREQVFLRYGLFMLHEGIELPIDVKKADYLFFCPSAANTNFPDYSIKLPKIFNTAGISYTFSSRIIDTGTELYHILADTEYTRRIILEMEEEALRLDAKQILIAECGCDVRTFCVDATRILGRELRVPVRSVDSLFIECISSGALPVVPVDDPVTFHDPCYVVRLAGRGDQERELIRLVASNFIEMEPHGEYNYCCNGGAGVKRLPENTEIRRKVGKLKARQIAMTGARRVITSCADCMITLEDLCVHYGFTRPGERMSYATFEIVHEAALRALAKRGEEGRMRMPRELAGRDSGFMEQHSLSALIGMLRRHPEFPAFREWLAGDAVTRRYFGEREAIVNAMEVLGWYAKH